MTKSAALEPGAVVEADVEVADDLPGLIRDLDALDRILVPDGEVQVASGRRDRAGGRGSRAAGVGLDDLIEVDVAPAPLTVVHHAERRGLPGEVGHVPGRPGEPLGAAGVVVRSGGRPDGLPGDHEVDASLARPLPPADQEVQIPALQAERRRGQRPLGVVPPGERVDQPAPLEPLDAHLPRQRTRGGSGAEGDPFGMPPGGVGGSLEVGDDEVGPAVVGAGDRAPEPGQDDDQRHKPVEHGVTSGAVRNVDRGSKPTEAGGAPGGGSPVRFLFIAEADP